MTVLVPGVPAWKTPSRSTRPRTAGVARQVGVPAAGPYVSS
ncbi:hypothetical protein AB0B86_24290 [Micromonospora sp. NPDC049047]